jgi:hypothetical protein
MEFFKMYLTIADQDPDNRRPTWWVDWTSDEDTLSDELRNYVAENGYPEVPNVPLRELLDWIVAHAPNIGFILAASREAKQAKQYLRYNF